MRVAQLIVLGIILSSCGTPDRQPQKQPIVFKAITLEGGTSVLLAAGVETTGLARGPAIQIWDRSGKLLVTQFVLTPDFTEIRAFGANTDGVAGDEIVLGVRETRSLARGPVFQVRAVDGSLVLARSVLNQDFSEAAFAKLDVNNDGVDEILVMGKETSGPARGPTFQIWDGSGNLLLTRFVLNPDFTADSQFLGADLDEMAGDEVIVGGREVSGLARGPSFEVWNTTGSLLLSRFVLNPDFAEVKFGMTNVGGNSLLVSGRETGGLARGPAFQIWDGSGNLLLTRFVLNSDFTHIQVFGANTSDGVAGDEVVTGGLESGGLARAPAFQIWDQKGNLLLARSVLNPDFTAPVFAKIDINGDGVHEILVGGVEARGLARGPAFQIWDGSGNLLLTRFVLNQDFTDLKVFALDQDGDGHDEIGVGGVESSGLMRGPAYQVWESDGTLLFTNFVLNSDFVLKHGDFKERMRQLATSFFDLLGKFDPRREGSPFRLRHRTN